MFWLIRAVDAEEGILVTLIQIKGAGAHGILRSSFHKIKHVAELTFDRRSWVQLGVPLASQCLDRRIADKQILAHEDTDGRIAVSFASK